MKRVSLFMDVEDPINPLADEAALDFPRLFKEAGVVGSFCLTGEKCRTLLARGRSDVLDAYAGHCLGLHTDTHSFHPTTMELLADVDWDEGCRLAFEAERKGVEAFVRAFGRKPCFWGGAGNTWSAEITDAMKRLGIPAQVYALTEFPDYAVHRFNGVLALNQALWISETEWLDAAKSEVAVHRVERGLQEIDQPWIGIFVGHPTKFRYKEFWDVPFFEGNSPLVPAQATPHLEEDYGRAKANLFEFINELKTKVDIVGIDDVLEMKWSYRTPSQSEKEYFVEKTTKNIEAAAAWPIHRPGLDSLNICRKAISLASTAEIAAIA